MEKEVEMDFEELDPAKQEEIMREMEKARKCLEEDTQFLTAPLESPEEPVARGLLSIAPVNDHGIDQYLFKLGCAIIEGYLT